MLRHYSDSCYILAKVVDVGDGIYLYHCCPCCFSRTLHDGNGWLCMKCRKTSDVANFRYRVTFVICDGCQVVDVTVFGSLLDPYFGCSALDFGRHLEKMYGSYQAQIHVKTTMKESFIGNSFWFGFPKPVSNQGGSEQFHYKFEPIVHQFSCSSSLIARHMILLSSYRDFFIPVFKRLLLSECSTAGRQISNCDIEEVDCDNELTPVNIKPVAELSENAGNVFELTCQRIHSDGSSNKRFDLSVGDSELVESVAHHLKFESEEIDFDQSCVSLDDLAAESQCLSSDDLFSDSSEIDHYVNSSSDDLFQNESIFIMELQEEEGASLRNNFACTRSLGDFLEDGESEIEPMSSNKSNDTFPEVCLVQMHSPEVKFVELSDTFKRFCDVDSDLNYSGDIFDNSSTMDQSMTCCSTPIKN